jgi:hypothetical protein
MKEFVFIDQHDNRHYANKLEELLTSLNSKSYTVLYREVDGVTTQVGYVIAGLQLVGYRLYERD